MKIGILTQPLLNNYGGLLQNYALQQVLKGMGHEVETIDWRYPAPSKSVKEWLWKRKEMFLSKIQKDRKEPRYQLNAVEEMIVSQNTNSFINNYLNVYPQSIQSAETFSKTYEQSHYNAYIVGSDQVWRPRYNAYLTSMFLDFVKHDKIKKIAYAASFGTSAWEFTPQMTEKCASLAKQFDLITVREKSGVTLCREHLGVEATYVLDPTMLLNREDYEKVVMEENINKSVGTLFYYILDPSEEKRGLIERVAREQGLQPFTIMPKCQAENRTRWDVKHRIEDCVFPSVTSWLRGFMDAEMVIVDSFHGAVFSIIFNKLFWVLGNSRRGNARFESLLGMFGLEERMIGLDQKVDWRKEIDWVRVNDIRQSEKERSIALLKRELTTNDIGKQWQK